MSSPSSSSASSALTTTQFPNLKLISRGKVRDVYATSHPDRLLFVATDRISAYDVILNNVRSPLLLLSQTPDSTTINTLSQKKKKGIPDKGKHLTTLSLFWFHKLAHIIPNHLLTSDLTQMPPDVQQQQHSSQLSGRTMLVRRATVIPIEAIVRGYLSGSAWSEYKSSSTIHGVRLPTGLVESARLPSGPMFTPSTKAEQGAHDENISPEQAARLVGAELYARVEAAALALYEAAAEYAFARGVILADTKFEFGLVPAVDEDGRGEGQELILVDELLTPDSSRYWPRDKYEPGRAQESFDKQYVRDWLVSNGFRKGLESGPEGREGLGWTLEESVVKGTRERYQEVVDILTRPEEEKK